MKLTIMETEEAFDREAAMRVSRQVLINPESLIGLATGDTTKNIYAWMVKLHKELEIDYSRIKTCNLDEYVGVSGSNCSSCRYRIKESLLDHINIKPENGYVPNGLCEPSEAELGIFKERVEGFGGFDFILLGVGNNGHIAFNEPGTPFNTTYRIAPISQGTQKDKSGLFGGDVYVPKYGITMGIRDIMAAKKILLVAKGSNKATIIKKIFTGDVSVDVPASVITLHPNAEILIDRLAAALI